MAKKTRRPKKKKMTKDQKIRSSYQNQIINLTQTMMEKFGERPPNYVISADLKTLPTHKLKGLRDSLQDKLQYLTEKLREAIAKEKEENAKAGLVCAQCDSIIMKEDMEAGLATVDLCKDCTSDF